jgi:hypothetical protein
MGMLQVIENIHHLLPGLPDSPLLAKGLVLEQRVETFRPARTWSWPPGQ